MTHLAVYLIHYMAPEWVESACASLADSSDVDVDITVVDNSGELETFQNVSRVLRPGSNLGYAGGANVALRDGGVDFRTMTT